MKGAARFGGPVPSLPFTMEAEERIDVTFREQKMGPPESDGPIPRISLAVVRLVEDAERPDIQLGAGLDPVVVDARGHLLSGTPGGIPLDALRTSRELTLDE